MDAADLQDRLRQEPPIEVDLDALLRRTATRVQDDRGVAARARRLTTPARVALVSAVAVAAVGGTLALAPRADLGVYPGPRMAVAIAGLAVALLFSLAIAMRPEWRPGLDRDRQRRWTVLALALPAAIAALPRAHAATELPDVPFALAAAVCFAFGSAIAGVVWATWRLVERRTDPIVGHRIAAVAAAAAVGNLALQVHCANPTPGHLLAGHATVGLVWALCAWWLGRRVV